MINDKLNDKFDIYKLSKKLLPGIIALILLMIIVGNAEFYDWFFNKLVFYLILLFFYKPVIRIFTTGTLAGDKKLFIIGVVLFIPYVLFYQITFLACLQTILEITAIISFFWAILGKMRDVIV